MVKIAVVGTGRMARLRTRIFSLLSDDCEVCGVVSKEIENARRFAKDFHCAKYTDCYQELLQFEPDAVLIEVPHLVQNEIVLWALEAGLHVLIGGCLATHTAVGAKISNLAKVKGLVVEAGYEARYKDVWNFTRDYVARGYIGEPIAVRSIALYDADPLSWYYDELRSGGMIITHMSYAFLNPIRWILGSPLSISAFSNTKCETGSRKVKHETCSANFLFKSNVICNMIGGYVKPRDLQAWQVSLIGSEGHIDLQPGDQERGTFTFQSNSNSTTVRVHESKTDNGFMRQAKAFLGTIQGKNLTLNCPADSLIDVQIAESIARSAQQHETLEFAAVSDQFA
jgi:myo-inositol 2-dehydrogenase/D-chiro-inositol 1-dehydrogenase